jgi:uncharacterized membrane protein HdeD (DUF308 family)
MNDNAQPLKKASNRGMIWGLLTIFLGVLAIGSPLVSGLAVAITVGAVLLLAGISMTLFAFQAPSFGRGLLRLLFCAHTVMVGK